MLYSTLLTIHIIAGFCSLISAFAAIFTAKGRKWHMYSGRIYFVGMTIIFVTSIPMSILKPNPFLLLIAIFSFYLALSGWRFAKNRRGTPTLLDWGISGIMVVTSLVMVGYGLYMLLLRESMGITIIVFGLIGGGLGWTNLSLLRKGGAKGKERIVHHLNSMLGGTIATITAFVVTNFKMEPEVVLWLAPTLIITPIIVWWNRQVLSGRKKLV